MGHAPGFPAAVAHSLFRPFVSQTLIASPAESTLSQLLFRSIRTGFA